MRKVKINLEIANALAWAVILIACSLFTQGNENIFNIFLAGSTLSYLWVDDLIHKKKISCTKK